MKEGVYYSFFFFFFEYFDNQISIIRPKLSKLRNTAVFWVSDTMTKHFCGKSFSLLSTTLNDDILLYFIENKKFVYQNIKKNKNILSRYTYMYIYN